MFNSLDAMLEGEEPIVQAMTAELGPLAAKQWVGRFNNACIQIRCFEEHLAAQQLKGNTFNAPLYNLSRHDCH